LLYTIHCSLAYYYL